MNGRREISFLNKNIDWRLCLIADKEAAGQRDLITLVRQAVDGGATLVQLRAKKLSTKDFLELALGLIRLLKKQKIPLIINDRVDVALACGAQGVHLGQDDMPLAFARKILGPSRLVGISVNTPEEAERGEKEGADYLGVGPVAYTSSKEELRTILGLEGLRRIRERIKIPILAVGGVNASNAREVIRAGANGVAIISAILGAENIKKASAKLRQSIDAAYENY